MTTAAMPTVLITQLYGAFPMQGQGTIDGHPFYFWIRWGAWGCAIADARDGDAVDVAVTGVGGRVFGEQLEDNPDVYRGVMSDGEAVTLIYRCAQAWAEGKQQ